MFLKFYFNLGEKSRRWGKEEEEIGKRKGRDGGKRRKRMGKEEGRKIIKKYIINNLT